MAEIEFLTAGADESELAASEAPSGAMRWRRHLPSTVAAGLWTAAAALCVLGPFRALYQERLPDAGEEGVDGWGRLFRTGVFQGDYGAFHGTRYGVVLVGCALAFSLLALTTAGLAWTQPRWTRSARGLLVLRRVVPGAAFTLTGLVAGVASAALLDAMSAQDNFDATLGSASSSVGFPLPSGRPAFAIGAGVWFAFGAAACAIAAALASCVTPPEPADPSVPPEPPPTWTPPDERDEMLGS